MKYKDTETGRDKTHTRNTPFLFLLFIQLAPHEYQIFPTHRMHKALDFFFSLETYLPSMCFDLLTIFAFSSFFFCLGIHLRIE